jgi:hypothetical protein
MSEKRTMGALVFEEQGEIGINPAPAEPGGGGTLQDTNPVSANLALKEIGLKAKDAGVVLKDTVIAFRTSGGRVKVRPTKDLTAGKGAGRGALRGFLWWA